jgi:hypothetical protein
MNALPHLIVRKTADQSKVSDTTLADDNTLALTVATNEIWLITLYLLYEGSSTGDFKYAFTFPSGTLGGTCVWYDQTNTLGVTNSYFYATTSPSAAKNLTGQASGITVGPVPINMLYVGGGVGGSVKFQWAQNVSDATATIVKANSTLWAVKLA